MSQKNEHSGIESYFQSVQALQRRVIESQCGVLERTSGLAGPLLDRYQPQPGEMIFIFSNSGVNQMPVETACRLRGAGEEPSVFASFNAPGAAEHNAALLEKWKNIPI